MRSVVWYKGRAALSSSVPSTYLFGVIMMKRAPQKVKPSPMKARIWVSPIMENVSERIPGIKKMVPILAEVVAIMLRFGFKSFSSP